MGFDHQLSEIDGSYLAEHISDLSMNDGLTIDEAIEELCVGLHASLCTHIKKYGDSTLTLNW